jgi:chromate reductase
MLQPADALRVCAIAGSLRMDSFNKCVVHTAVELAPERVAIEVFSGLGDVPLFNQDLEAKGDPAPVVALKNAISNSDAVLISTPEYNGGIPGVLKNALDWASRKGADAASVLAGKPFAVMGATPGRLGTARAQVQLRQTLAGAGAIVMPKPEVHLMSVSGLVVAGALVDDRARVMVGRLLESLADWAPRVSS